MESSGALSDQNAETKSQLTAAKTSSSPNTVAKINSPCKKHVTAPGKGKKNKSGRAKDTPDSSGEDLTSSSTSSCSSSSDTDSSSEPGGVLHSDLPTKNSRTTKVRKANTKAKAKAVKQKKRSRKSTTMTDDSEADSETTALANELLRGKIDKAVKAALRQLNYIKDAETLDVGEDPEASGFRNLQSQLRDLGFQTTPPAPLMPPPPQAPTSTQRTRTIHGRRATCLDERLPLKDNDSIKSHRSKSAEPEPPAEPASKVAFKRVDQIWDVNIGNFKLRESVKSPDEAEWDQYIFTVRRKFDYDQRFLGTLVDVKSKSLRECIKHVMADVKGVNLMGDTFHLDPNMLFLYLEELRDYMATLFKDADSKKHKERKILRTKAKHLRVLIKYLDKDYQETKDTLYPMLENGMIAFDLLWALFKPNTIVYASTYGDDNEPRAFKLESAAKRSQMMRGTFYNIDGKYLEYDGKSFGLGGLEFEIEQFQGVRKITSLDCYPLKYHKKAEEVRVQLIERGKQFIQLQGQNYRYYRGMAYMKNKKQVAKIHIDGRIMVDPAIHRRINPNYPSSTVKPKEDINLMTFSFGGGDCNCDADTDDAANDRIGTSEDTLQNPTEERRVYRVVKNDQGEGMVVEVNPKDDDAIGGGEPLADKKQVNHEFSAEELLTASSLVLGFSFSEKLWLEFTVSGITDIVYNDQAFDSLVLPESHKSIIKALVSSHAFQGHKSIDDIISGKGRGLVAVLHGSPGTGKTLTAEGIADLLKCPLYMVSAGDLGTVPEKLEKELQSILDIAHSWGAILLLDEADVFLEERSTRDIHRNALVSVFLRLLEYFQGILFLTTNRVETFDSAFVSRIHLSLRFQNLNTKARRTVWKLFIDRVKNQEGMKVDEITEADYNDLARKDVNGRQIKNLVRGAQALAVYEDVPLSMVHIRRVIDVAQSFEMDLKGGTGYSDAMKSYA